MTRTAYDTIRRTSHDTTVHDATVAIEELGNIFRPRIRREPYKTTVNKLATKAKNATYCQGIDVWTLWLENKIEVDLSFKFGEQPLVPSQGTDHPKKEQKQQIEIANIETNGSDI